MKKFVPFVLATAALTLAGCGEKAAPPTSAPAAPAATAAAGLPPECDAYVKTVTACVEKVGGSNPAVATFKAQMEKNKAEWAKAPSKAALGPACKQMDDTFKSQTAPMLKC
jgi:hypothetical protein